MIAALAAAVGVAALLETLFPRVRGVNAVTSITGHRPLVVIPYIRNSSDARALREMKKWLVLVAVTVVVLALVAFHFAVQPLNELLSGPSGIPD